MDLHAHDPLQNTEAHLFGGPLDGTIVLCGPDTHGYADESTRALYTYCPHASALFERNTFISADLSHDICAR